MTQVDEESLFDVYAVLQSDGPTYFVGIGPELPVFPAQQDAESIVGLGLAGGTAESGGPWRYNPSFGP
jgi:hypothetical protein